MQFADSLYLHQLSDLGLKVLVTSQLIPKGVSPIPVHTLHEQEAVELFKTHSPHDSKGHLDLIKRICGAVEYLPLAIELAATSALPLRTQLKRIQESLDDLSVKELPEQHHDKRHLSIKACFSVSFERLSVSAQLLIQHLAVLPDGWSCEIIEQVAKELNIGWEATLAELVRRCFLRLRGDRYFSHGLIRRFAIDQLSDKQAGENLVGKAIAATVRQRE